MKEITYLIPTRYLTLKDEPLTKPIAVKAWETVVPGLIVQQPIVPRRGRVHLGHKASGTVLAFSLPSKKTAQLAARLLKKLPVKFTVSKPTGLYRQIARFSDRQIQDFRAAIGSRGKMDPGIFRLYAKTQAGKFDELHPPANRRTRGGQAKRSKKGDTWKGKGRKRTRQGR